MKAKEPMMSLLHKLFGSFRRVALAISLVTLPGLVLPVWAQSDLTRIFEPGMILQDRSGDGVVDFVNASIVLGDVPSPAIVAAAADIAARLGHETLAMNIPLNTRLSGSGQAACVGCILIGRGAVESAGLSMSEAGLNALGEGEGLVAAVEVRGQSYLVVAGADEAGTRAAAHAFAGRLPRLWEPKAPKLDELVADLRKVFASHGITVVSMQVPSVHVRSGGTAFSSITIEAEVASAADVAAVRAALQRLATDTSREGSEGEHTLSYPGVELLVIRLTASGAKPTSVELPRARAEAVRADAPVGRRPGSGSKAKLDLSSLYSIEGFFGDAGSNLIPDRLDVLLSPAGEGINGTIDLAARIGLESTGLSLPVAKPPDALGEPDSEPTLVLIGTHHPLLDQLVEKEKLPALTVEPGQGLIQVVRKAFGEKSAVLITGGDAAGSERALRQVAERFPYIWDRGKDRTTLDDVEEDVGRFVSLRSPAGQASAALYRLDGIAQDLSALDLEWARVRIHVEKAEEGLADFVEREGPRLFKGASVNVVVENLDVQLATPLITEEVEIPSEVDEFWRIFRAEVLPAVRRRQPVVIETRLSEPPEVRALLEKQVRAALLEAGAAEQGTRVTALSAYKQALSWATDVVRPQLVGQAIEQVTIRFAEIGPPPEWTQQAMYAPTRWLLEIFPVDELLARELDLKLSQFRFEKMPIGSPAYEMIVTAPGGREIFRDTFEPKFVVRPFFDRFPEYEKVRVTTGWITASVGGKSVVDRRIVTDLERFWDHYQGKTLPAIYDYVMALHEGRPEPKDAPYFGELTVDVTLSEPDYELGIDKERIAPMGSLQNEIYFATLHFFDVFGRHATGQSLAYPGRVIPIVRPKGDGQTGKASIRFTGFASPRPAVVVEYRERGGNEGSRRIDLRPVTVDRPEALAALVRDGRAGLEQLHVRIKVDTERDERELLIRRARTDRVESTIMSAQQVTAMTDHLGRLRSAGLYLDALAYHGLDELRIAAGWIHDVDVARQAVSRLEPNGRPAAWPDVRAYQQHTSAKEGGPLVQWETPIPPSEAYGILARMEAFPEATVYKMGESYLGKDIWAMDLMPPVEATHWSHAKATTFKPTVIYSARQHANEVSSTSHVLKLAELLLTDPDFRAKLNRVNVVVHPITNPDGAQLAYDLYKITPDYTLHAGYLGSLGVDVTSAQWDSDPIYPESTIRPTLWRTWLPDIFLNPHGYPSHEWVQVFSAYAAWVRARNTEARGWWGMRGWFMPGFSYLDDARHPRHKEAAFTIRDYITRNINAVPEVRALNERAYARYQRYGVDQDFENFKMDLTDDVLLYTSIKGARGTPNRGDFMSRQPNVTIWTGSTEAPDETAHGEWLELVATAGLQWGKAILQYLVDGNHQVERRAEAFHGGVSLSMNRPRPPKPAEKAATTTEPEVDR
jgi:hypothetical protein